LEFIAFPVRKNGVFGNRGANAQHRHKLPLDPSSFSIALVAAAFVAGVVDAIAGGGGLLTVPCLLAAGLPPHIALATNKAQSSFGATSSALSFWFKGGLDRSRAPRAFVFGFVGSIAGANALLRFKPEPLRPLILGLLVAAATFAVWPRPPGGGKPIALARFALAPIALALGFYDGFFGPGTGSILIVSFVIVFGDTMTRASGNAKVVNLASNLAALLIFATRNIIVWKIALPMAAANAAGAFMGARLAIGRGDRFVRLVVLVVVAALVVKVGVGIVYR
jgi:uncharacterized membrane protein YfcA